ncbi:MAG: hypothetical protein J6U17_05500 [Kiritimatiellae bacterium]|nr:hypothetical protein [Kiritimatiellia bacterium]
MHVLDMIFLLPIAAVVPAAAIHATGYLAGEPRRALLRFWGFFLATAASMAFVVLSPDRLSFLLAWEFMGLSSAGLVAFEHGERHVRKATWTYLLACHAGACALMLAGLFMDSAATFLAAFFCAVVGFGLKIGFPPFHVWLPEAHPAAPAPASAVMSGAMIPLGFYGLLRFFWPACAVVPYASAAGWTLLALGASGAVLGILFALPQANIKRLLAFSSVENMGIVGLALGLSVLAGVEDQSVSRLACAGALAHVLNHALLKGGLFLGAGSVLKATGTLDADRLGGLMKRMPFTGTLFTLNAAGLAGLPPLNGFLGELLIYAAAFDAAKSANPALAVAGFIALAALALAGGLAAAAYCKVVGAVFLGEPRGDEASAARETPARMWLAQLALFVLSVAMIPGTVILACRITSCGSDALLLSATGAGCAFAATVAILVVVRRFLCPRGGVKPSVPTWDCGYGEPTARMAYTATAFTQPLADLFAGLLKPRRHLVPFRGDPAAPTDAALATETDDRALAGFWRPLFSAAARALQRSHVIQNGSLHLYILLAILAVVALLVAALVS